jgi:hypothetical protein
METTTTTTRKTTDRRAAVNALAVVGFIALILIGIALAIYTARYMPKLASRFGSGSVSLSSIFHSSDENDQPSLDVVTSTTTLPIDDAVIATTTGSATDAGSKKPATGSAPTTVTTVRTVVTTGPGPMYGDPDLAVRITDVGYIRRDGDTDTFVSSDEVPDNRDGAVKFTVVNAGTNETDNNWKFEVEVPSSPSQTFTSPTQRNLKPGESIDYVLGFEKPKEGNNRDITVTVDPNDRVDESNERNNEASRSIDIEG